MVTKMFKSKKLTRRELSAKETIYNSFSFFAKEMQLPFKQSKNLWGYLARENQKTFAAYAGAETLCSRAKRKQLKSRVGDYPLIGPLGPQGPILPISMGNIHGAFNEPNGKTKGSGKSSRFIVGRRNSILSRNHLNHPGEQI